MTRLLCILAATCSILVGLAPASGQTLAERLRAVQRQRDRAQGASSVRTKILQTVVYGRTTVSFDATPARDAFEYLQTALGIKLVGRYRDDRPGHGIDPEAPITLDLVDAPVPQVLELVLEQCSVHEKCTWQVRSSFLEVGTRERLSGSAAQELRVYPVAALLFEAPNFDDAPAMGIDYGPYNYDPYITPNGPYGGYGSGGVSGSITVGGGGGSARDTQARGEELVELIVETIEPDAWTLNGGEWASIRYRDGVLIVRAPDYVHRQLNGYPGVPKPAVKKPTGD